MAVELEYPTVSEDGLTSPRQTAIVLRNCVEGKFNNKDEIELTLSSATTTITDIRIGPESQITLMPLDANAAAENWWISGRTDGSATINHANSALTRLFQYAIVG